MAPGPPEPFTAQAGPLVALTKGSPDGTTGRHSITLGAH